MKKAGMLWLSAVLAAGFAMTQFGCGGGGGGDGVNGGPPPLPEVAVLTNEADNNYAADVVDKLEATGKFSRVDTINAATLTPTVDQLLTYDGVLVYTGGNGPGLADTTAIGNVLADFVDGGGGLVVAYAAVVYSPGSQQYALGGRYVLGQYYLIPRVDFTLGSQMSDAVFDSTHPILDGFVTLDSGTQNGWADTTLVVTGATVVLEWADGKPLVVTDEINGVRRVDLNFYPPSSDSDNTLWVATTDGDKLMANSLIWVANWP